MPARLEAYGYGTEWHDISTDYYEGYSNSMTDYHMHDYYEISLILSGNVKVLLSDTSEQGRGAKLVLLRPHTPHYIVCDSDQLYRRHNLLFSPTLLADFPRDLQGLLPLFGKNGRVLTLGKEMCDRLLAIIEAIRKETSPLRQKLLVLYLLSLAAENAPESKAPATVPPLVSEALNYVAEHYGERIRAEQMAWTLHVGRTTLMTALRRYTGLTLVEYVTRTRVRIAAGLLGAGCTLEDAAERVGFGSGSGLVRAFKRVHGVTPRVYLKSTVARVGTLYKAVE